MKPPQAKGLASRVAQVALCAMLWAGAARAQSVSEEELVFWQAVQQSGRPAEYQAYLDAYPAGRFAPLARLRIGSAQPAQPSPPAPPTHVPSPGPSASQASQAAQAWVRPVSGRVQLVSGIVLDMDGSALRSGSNLRLAVMPANSADDIADQAQFLAESTPTTPRRLHLTIPSGPPGQNEVRLYFIPQFATTYAVAARAPIVVAPGARGAILARDLVREAERMGPIRFEAAHRDRSILIQAAFLRVRPQTEWNLQWFGGASVQEVARQIVIISIGLPGAAPDDQGSRGELICPLPASDAASLDRIAAMQVGDPVLVRGIPTSWSSATGADPVLLDRCSLAG